MTKLSIEQCVALLGVYQAVDSSRTGLIENLFDRLSIPIPGDGRTLHEALRQDCPELLKVLQALLQGWLDLSNEITALADAQISAIHEGTSPSTSLN